MSRLQTNQNELMLHKLNKIAKKAKAAELLKKRDQFNTSTI